jgi:CPA1 family monovalent cation:H+ antiporter
MHTPTVFGILFTIAAGVALAARSLNIPYTVALVVAGVGLGATHALRTPPLTKELLYDVFLPGLLFQASFHVKPREYWANKLVIHLLAVPGVVLASLGTAAILAVVAPGGMAWRPALVFATLTATTDPIAVVAVFRKVHAPSRLSLLVEAESLVNNGVAAILTTTAAGIAVGEPQTLLGGTWEFLREAGGGVLLGAGLAWVVSVVSSRVDDALIEITLTTIAAYCSFAFAEQLHFSGVVATVASGMVMGSDMACRAMSANTRGAVEAFWEYAAFALNSIVFLLMGFDVELGAQYRAMVPVGIAYLAIVLARALVVGGVSLVVRPTSERLSGVFSLLVSWGGLRGALSMVLALSLPESMPQRQLVITTTYGVVLLSLLVNGLSLAPLLRFLGVSERQTVTN